MSSFHGPFMRILKWTVITVGDHDFKLNICADDVLLMSPNPLSEERSVMKSISSLSGYQINWSKSEANLLSSDTFPSYMSTSSFIWTIKGTHLCLHSLCPRWNRSHSLSYAFTSVYVSELLDLFSYALHCYLLPVCIYCVMFEWFLMFCVCVSCQWDCRYKLAKD